MLSSGGAAAQEKHFCYKHDVAIGVVQNQVGKHGCSGYFCRCNSVRRAGVYDALIGQIKHLAQGIVIGICKSH